MDAIQSLVANETTKPAGTAERRPADLQEACADFESVLTYYMFKSMRATVPDSGLIKKDNSFTMLMDQKMAEQLSQKGEGLGLQRILYRQLSQGGEK